MKTAATAALFSGVKIRNKVFIPILRRVNF